MAETDASAYLLGRPSGKLAAPYQGADLAFGAARLDGQRIENGEFSHCTFANISFKEVDLRNSGFLNCVFIGCYFRRAELASSRFVGCRFFDCNFSHVAIMSASGTEPLDKGVLFIHGSRGEDVPYVMALPFMTVRNEAAT